MKTQLHLNIPITKIDEDQRMVYGFATVEELDSHGDIITYEASKKAFSDWIGNIREMHEEKAIGKAMEVSFDDDKKGVWVGSRISESDDGEQAWIKIKEGVYAGYSIGGSINETEVREMSVDGKKKAVRVITDYNLGETSIVDNPAVASAVFQMVKNRGGDLIHEEKMLEKSSRPVAWWERLYKFSDSQNVMKGSIITYNENSMADKRPELAKSLWEAGMLVDLAMCLSDYIYWKAWEGEDMEELKGALEAIQSAAAKEVSEPENFPEVDMAIENAAKALNISKKEELVTMSKEVKKMKKSTVGQEDRDAEANVTTTAEENGRPADDTEERAAAAAEDNAAEKPEEKEEPETPDTEEEDGAEDEDQPEDEAPADEDAEEAEDKSKGKGKKSAKADFKKSTEDASDITKSILSGVEALIEKSVTPLKEEIESLKKQAAPSKVRQTYTVKKGEDVDSPEDNSEEAKLRKEFDGLIKRSEELEANPSQGTHQERLNIAFKLRKLSRQLDPASVAKHAAVKATFNTSQ